MFWYLKMKGLKLAAFMGNLLPYKFTIVIIADDVSNFIQSLYESQIYMHMKCHQTLKCLLQYASTEIQYPSSRQDNLEITSC